MIASALLPPNPVEIGLGEGGPQDEVREEPPARLGIGRGDSQREDDGVGIRGRTDRAAQRRHRARDPGRVAAAGAAQGECGHDIGESGPAHPDRRRRRRERPTSA